MVIEPLDIVQHEHLPVADRQLPDRALQVETQTRIAGHAMVLRLHSLTHTPDPSLAAAHEIEATIERQAVEPRADRRLALEPAHLLICEEEDLLQDVLSLFERAGHPARQAVNPPCVLA